MPIKLSSLLLAGLLLIATQVSGQKIDQVVLKNGSVVRGEITQMVPEGNLIIDDRAGNTWVFPMTEISEISRVEDARSIASAGFEKGWVNMTTIGFLAGSSSSEQIAPFTLLNSFGYRQSSGLFTGLTTGIEFLNINHVPLMAELQYTLRNAGVSPVALFRGGYMLPVRATAEEYGNEYSYSGGPVGSIGVGLKIRSKESFAWDVSVLYRYMQIRYSETYEWNDSEYKYTDIYNRLELRLGFYLD
jgi:hypothetical protein